MCLLLLEITDKGKQSLELTIDILPGILSGFLLAFTMSLDDFIITHFTKGAGINTISTLVYSEVRKGIKPSLYALSTIMFVAVLILLLIMNKPKKEKKN